MVQVQELDYNDWYIGKYKLHIWDGILNNTPELQMKNKCELNINKHTEHP